jgi:small subunit ribosomal protein S6
MRPYEVMVIFDTGAEPPAIQAVVDRAIETVRANDGTPGHVDRWGRRPFAYEVKHRREGYYVLVEFSGTSQTVAELDRLLSLADEVLRHKVIRLPEKAVRRSSASGPGRSGRGSRAARTDGAAAHTPTGDEHPGATEAPGTNPDPSEAAEREASNALPAAG